MFMSLIMTIMINKSDAISSSSFAMSVMSKGLEAVLIASILLKCTDKYPQTVKVELIARRRVYGGVGSRVLLGLNTYRCR